MNKAIRLFGWGTLLVSSCFYLSCIGDGEGVDANGIMIPTAGVPAYAAVQTIFNNNCTSCHGSFGGLSLEAGSSYENLVNVASTEVPSLKRVTPEDPTSSYLYEKISTDTPQSGGRMPYGQPALSQSDIDLIEAWINCGAPEPSDNSVCPGVND